jgi:shikimate dehydrogenase
VIEIISITGKTRIAGLFGWPVSHSLSPQMHNAAFECLGLNMCYLPFPVRPGDLQKAMDGIRAMSFAGVNITIPHKIKAIELVDQLSPEALATGAINTVVNNRSHLTGYNTDIYGITTAIKNCSRESMEGKKAIIAGAGGSARAAAYAMALAGCREIYVVNRTLPRAEELCHVLKNSLQISMLSGCTFTPGKLSDLGNLAGSPEVSIFINATPLGLAGETGLFPEIINSKHKPVICDLVYSPKGTSLSKEARQKGLPTVDGLSVLVYQGAKSFELWTRLKAPVDVMMKVVKGLRS